MGSSWNTVVRWFFVEKFEMMERFSATNNRSRKLKTYGKKDDFQWSGSHPRLYPTCLSLMSFSPTKWHLCNRPFVASGMLQQQWCHGPHNNTDLAESEGFGGCQGRAKEMARFWKSTEGMAVKNYLEMKVPWKKSSKFAFGRENLLLT